MSMLVKQEGRALSRAQNERGGVPRLWYIVGHARHATQKWVRPSARNGLSRGEELELKSSCQFRVNTHRVVEGSDSER